MFLALLGALPRRSGSAARTIAPRRSFVTALRWSIVVDRAVAGAFSFVHCAGRKIPSDAAGARAPCSDRPAGLARTRRRAQRGDLPHRRAGRSARAARDLYAR
jgi:hypothetical protein